MNAVPQRSITSAVTSVFLPIVVALLSLLAIPGLNDIGLPLTALTTVIVAAPLIEFQYIALLPAFTLSFSIMASMPEFILFAVLILLIVPIVCVALFLPTIQQVSAVVTTLSAMVLTALKENLLVELALVAFLSFVFTRSKPLIASSEVSEPQPSYTILSYVLLNLTALAALAVMILAIVKLFQVDLLANESNPNLGLDVFVVSFRFVVAWGFILFGFVLGFASPAAWPNTLRVVALISAEVGGPILSGILFPFGVILLLIAFGLAMGPIFRAMIPNGHQLSAGLLGAAILGTASAALIRIPVSNFYNLLTLGILDRLIVLPPAYLVVITIRYQQKQIRKENEQRKQ